MKKILIVDDEKIVLDFMSYILYGFEVDCCLNVEEAIKKYNNKNYDLIITDLVMSPIDGFTFMKMIDKDIPIIVFSSLTDRKSLVEAYECGAIDYINKPIDEEITLIKIKNLLNMQGEKNISFNDDLTVSFFGEVISFTRTEYEILKLLCTNPSRIYSKEDLIKIIWYGNESMSSKIIDVNISNIRKKLGKHAKKIITIRNVGYKYEK